MLRKKILAFIFCILAIRDSFASQDIPDDCSVITSYFEESSLPTFIYWYGKKLIRPRLLHSLTTEKHKTVLKVTLCLIRNLEKTEKIEVSKFISSLKSQNNKIYSSEGVEAIEFQACIYGQEISETDSIASFSSITSFASSNVTDYSANYFCRMVRQSSKSLPEMSMEEPYFDEEIQDDILLQTFIAMDATDLPKERVFEAKNKKGNIAKLLEIDEVYHLEIGPYRINLVTNDNFLGRNALNLFLNKKNSKKTVVFLGRSIGKSSHMSGKFLIKKQLELLISLLPKRHPEQWSISDLSNEEAFHNAAIFKDTANKLSNTELRTELERIAKDIEEEVIRNVEDFKNDLLKEIEALEKVVNEDCLEILRYTKEPDRVWQKGKEWRKKHLPNFKKDFESVIDTDELKKEIKTWFDATKEFILEYKKSCEEYKKCENASVIHTNLEILKSNLLNKSEMTEIERKRFRWVLNQISFSIRIILDKIDTPLLTCEASLDDFAEMFVNFAIKSCSYSLQQVLFALQYSLGIMSESGFIIYDSSFPALTDYLPVNDDKYIDDNNNDYKNILFENLCEFSPNLACSLAGIETEQKNEIVEKLRELFPKAYLGNFGYLVASIKQKKIE